MAVLSLWLSLCCFVPSLTAHINKKTSFYSSFNNHKNRVHQMINQNRYSVLSFRVLDGLLILHLSNFAISQYMDISEGSLNKP